MLAWCGFRVGLIAALLFVLAPWAGAQDQSPMDAGVESLIKHFLEEYIPSRTVVPAATITCPPELVEGNPKRLLLCVFVGSGNKTVVQMTVNMAVTKDGHRFDEPPPYNYWMDRGGYMARMLVFTPTGDFLLVQIHDGTANDSGGSTVAMGSLVAFIW